MPVEPPPTRWSLAAPPDDHPDDLWGLGGDLEPGTLLAAYRLGLFPMRAGGEIGWWSPARRGVIPLAGYRPSRSLRRAARGFEIRTDTALPEVISGCADPTRPGGWIDDGIVAAYVRLHALGWVHSVEAWDDEGLAGGLYGVAIGGLFAAESKFHFRTGASKAALLGLIDHLRAAGEAESRLLDVQWVTPHLAWLGAIAVPRSEYRRRLELALSVPDAWGQVLRPRE